MTPIFDEIRPTDLADWATRSESERWMPSLVRQLILGSGARLRQCRFLTHEQTNLGGWDGIVETEVAGLHVPKGFSGWELSKEDDDRVLKKALEDVEKRTRQPGDLVPADTACIVVTMRVWPRRRCDDGSYEESHQHKMAWAREQVTAFGWREVLVLDAIDMAGWIAQQPDVGIWMSHVMGRNVRGARSLVLHWKDLEKIYPKLSPSVFLAGRDAFSKDLDTWISESSAQALELRSWSHEDVRDAVAAWWRKRTAADSLSAVPPIAVTTSEAWEYLARTSKPLLLLADGGLEICPEQISAAIAYGHYVLLRTTAGHSLEERHQAMLKLHALADKLDLEFPIVAAILRSAAKSQEDSLNERHRDDD